MSTMCALTLVSPSVSKPTTPPWVDAPLFLRTVVNQSVVSCSVLVMTVIVVLPRVVVIVDWVCAVVLIHNDRCLATRHNAVYRTGTPWHTPATDLARFL